MKYIGGFIELESAAAGADSAFHSGTVCLQNGRACLNFILKKIKPSKIYLPALCCDSLVEPVLLNEIPHEFYLLDDSLMPALQIDLLENEYLVFINYAGICKSNADRLYDRYGKQLIIDNTQAFFEKQYKDCYSFNSARKFFGVPDGAYLFGPGNFAEEIANLPANPSASIGHLLLRKQGEQEKAYAAFVAYENAMHADLYKVSEAGEKILNSIDYSAVIQKRRMNFEFLDEKLGNRNGLQLLYPEDAVPHYYPYLPETKIDRKALAAKGIFIPVFWSEVSKRVDAYCLETILIENMLPLPVDQRYTEGDLERLVRELG